MEGCARSDAIESQTTFKCQKYADFLVRKAICFFNGSECFLCYFCNRGNGPFFKWYLHFCNDEGSVIVGEGVLEFR